MGVFIARVRAGSPAAQKGMRPGDELLAINANPVSDVLDYQFYIHDAVLRLAYRRGGAFYCVKLHKEEYDDLGLEFETYLMDKQRHCKNKCIFCFIDQLPPGMRESLYFKDDDSRLSFLFGNYITLTNITEHEVERIIKMHISPVNISVHTMNPALRVQMMRNPKAGECLSLLRRFADAGIRMNTQLVLCPGVNDGEELDYSLQELGKLYPAVSSIAAVPVGLTRYRDGLYPLQPYTTETAADVLDRMERFGSAFLQAHGTRLAYPADEFYLKAGREIPSSDFYEEFAQIENGVGMWASLRDEFMETLAHEQFCPKPRRVTIATGTAAFPLLRSLANALEAKRPNVQVQVIAVRNRFFGEKITVSGLLTGQDLEQQLAGQDLGDALLIPSNMLRREGDLFLDSMSIDTLSARLNVRIEPVPSDGAALCAAILGV